MMTVPDGVLNRHFAASVAELANGGNAQYQAVAQSTAEVARARRNDQVLIPSLMPLGYFSIRSTIQAFSDPVVQERMPREVYHRAEAMRNCARLMAGNVIQTGELARFYRSNQQLRPLYWQRSSTLPHILSSLSDKNQELVDIGDVAIFDTAIVAGGALRYIESVHPEALKKEPAAHIVGQSSGLLLGAKVMEDYLKRMRTTLGYPYMRTDCFAPIEIRGDEQKQLRLAFTPEVYTFLRGLQGPGRGCPAHYAVIQAAHGRDGVLDEPTLLREGWRMINDVLLLPGATTRMPSHRAGKQGQKPKRKR